MIFTAIKLLQDILASRHVQTQTVTSVRGGSSGGEDASYLDITITEVADYTKCEVDVGNMWFYDNSLGQITGAGAGDCYLVTARLTSNTNLRLSSRASSSVHKFIGRWRVTGKLA